MMVNVARPARIMMILLGFALIQRQRIEQISQIMSIHVTVGRVWRTIMTNKNIEEIKRNIDKLVEGLKKQEDENARLKATVKSQRDKIDSLLKELEEERGKTITISDGAITMRADMWEALNENKALKDENTALKQRIKDLEDIGNNYEPQFAPDDDISAFNYECVKQWTTEMGCKRKIQELQDQHQQDCIRYNDMRTAYLVTLDELARLREQFGAGN